MINNTTYGIGSLQNNSGDDNTGIGAYAAYNNLDASNNTAVGSNSAYFNTTGSNNTSMGAGSMCNNTTGSLNTAIGSSALEGILELSVGDQNTAIGVQSLYTNHGNLNTAIGAYAALGVADGNYNTFLGANTSTLYDLDYDYSTAIGYNSKISDSNQIMMGGAGPSGYPNVVIPGNAYLPNFIAAGATNDQIVPKSYVDNQISGNVTCNSLTITPTNPSAVNPTAGITNTWNSGGFLAFADAGGTTTNTPGGLTCANNKVRIDSWSTTPGGSISLFEINFTFNNTTNWGQTCCYLQLYPTRYWPTGLGITDKWAIDNKINGDNSYSITDLTYAPNGRWYWTYQQNFSGMSGAVNAWLVPGAGFVDIYFRLPDNTYSYECYIKCLDASTMVSAGQSWELRKLSL